ncbi:MAG: fibronectin type III domain-containing protein [Nocardioidaceae bacterium]
MSGARGSCRRRVRAAVLSTVLVIAGLTGFSAIGPHSSPAFGAGDTDDEIHASFGNTPDEMWLYWRGPDDTVQYGTDSSYGSTATAAAPSVQPVDNAGPFWQVELAGLSPGTTYHYEIGPSGLDHTFQTAPTGDFTWDDIGDTGTTYYNPAAGSICNKTWMADVWQQVAADQPAFVTHGGDITYANECGVPSVHQFWNDIAPIATQAAMQFAWGNHEYGPPRNAPAGTPRDSMANYKGRFNMPNPQTVPNDTPSQTGNPGCPAPGSPKTNGCLGNDWGYFTAGHVLFITYPEPWYNAYPAWQTEADALMAQAEADPNIYVIVTYGHRPAYTSLGTAASQALRTAINALGDKYAPTARPDGKYVLNIGHHIHGGEVFSPQHGVVNVTDGGGGSEETSINTPSAGSLWHTNHLEHLRVDVVGDQMTLNFICGPVFTPSPNKDPCVEGTDLYTTTLTGYVDGPPAPVLSTSLSDGVTNVTDGQQVTYTATVQNTGTADTTNGVSLDVTLPTNLTIGQTDGTVNGQSVSWSLGDLAAGASVSKTVQAIVEDNAVGDALATQAQVTADACSDSRSVCSATDTDTVASPPPPTRDYISNPSVETSTVGWTGRYNTRSVIGRATNDAYDGTSSLQVARSAGTAGPAGVISSPRPVTSTAAGGAYTGTVWVHGQQARQTVNLVLREVNPAGKIVLAKATTLTLADNSNWYQLTTGLTAVAAGDQIAFVVYSPRLAGGAWFHADLMSLIGPS